MSAPETTALATTGLSIFDKIADPMVAIKEMGDFLAKSGMFGCTKTEQGQVIALTCMCERKTPIEILRTYHIIEGKLSMRADAMLAAYRGRGGKVTWKQFNDEAAIGIWDFDRVATTIGFTMEDAKRAGVVKLGSAWTKYPDAMLRARCISKAIRMLCPEAVSGVYTPEEINDFNNEGPPQMNEPKAAKAQTTVKAEVLKPEAAAKVAEVVKIVEGTVVDGPPLKQEAPTGANKPAPPKTEPKVEKMEENPLPKQHEAVAMIMKGREAEVLKWFVANKWISEGQGFADLYQQDCERILSRPDPFLRAVGQGKAIASTRPVPK